MTVVSKALLFNDLASVCNIFYPVWFVHLRRKESRRAALSIPSVDWGIPALMLLLYIFQQHKLLACATLLPRAFCLVIENGGNSNTSLPVSNWHILQLPWIWDQCQTDPKKPQFGAYRHDWKLLKKHLHLSAIKTKTTTTTTTTIFKTCPSE